MVEASSAGVVVAGVVVAGVVVAGVLVDATPTSLPWTVDGLCCPAMRSTPPLAHPAMASAPNEAAANNRRRRGPSWRGTVRRVTRVVVVEASEPHPSL